MLGLEEEAREGQSVYLRGWGDYLRYSLKLTESPRAGLGHVALRAWSPAALDRRVAAVEETGLGLGWIDGDVGHGPAYRFTDPDGHVFELYYEAERYRAPEHLRPSWRNQPQRYVGRGAAVKRLDHVNVLAADVRANRVFAQEVLGYRLYERIELDDGTEQGAWLSLSIAAHELIYVADAYGARGRLHHLAFWVDTREECLRAADLFVDNERLHRGGALEARGRAGLLPLRVRAGRQPDRGDDRRLLRLRPGLRADRVDAGGACPRPVLGRPDDRELPHVRHAGHRERGVTSAVPVPLRERFAEPDRFVVAAEIVTSRGLITADGGGKVLELARELAADPRIDVLSITDNPGGHAMFSPDALGTDLISRGQEVIIHLACKDWNRNALESRGWQLCSQGFHNVLALSGDYPVMGHRGLAAPVFDIDSVGLLSLFSDMNEGLRDERTPDARLERTDFFLGCVVTNHKRHEREVMPQYFKLRKKAQAGARFVINQAGWDTRKDDELLRWIRRDGLDLFAVANVYLLSRTAARAFRRGIIPGHRRHRRAARAGGAPGCEPGQGPSLLRRSWLPSTSLSRADSASTASTSAGTCPRPRSARSSTGALVRRGRLAGVRTRDPVPCRGRVLLLRARPARPGSRPTR